MFAAGDGTALGVRRTSRTREALLEPKRRRKSGCWQNL